MNSRALTSARRRRPIPAPRPQLGRRQTINRAGGFRWPTEGRYSLCDRAYLSVGPNPLGVVCNLTRAAIGGLVPLSAGRGSRLFND